MMKHLLAAGLVAAVSIPSLASAQSNCQDRRHDNRVAGTVIGAGLGALLGNVVSEGGGKTGGTIIGGVGGAVAGNVIAGSGTHCGENRYGYYDQSGQWVPNTRNAEGYYDANGQWVTTRADYAPRSDQGYAQPSEQGYAQPYDQRDAQPSYQGYAQPSDPNYARPAYQTYAQPSDQGYAQPAPGYSQDGAYSNRDRWADAPRDTRQREAWLDRRIRQQMANGQLGYREGRRALRDLASIRQRDNSYRNYDGRLNRDQQDYIEAQLAQVRDRVRGQDRPQSY